MGYRSSLLVFTLAYIVAAAVADVATSHQSVVSGEGWRYGYGIVNTPYGDGFVTGESYPFGFGGFGAYAPKFTNYGFNNYYTIPKFYYSKIPHHLIPHHSIPHHSISPLTLPPPPPLIPLELKNGLNLQYNHYPYFNDDYIYKW